MHNTELKMENLKQTARKAGILYFIWVLTAIYGLMYVQSKTIVKNDVSATAAKIIENEFIFRTGIVNGILSNIVWIFLAITLYKLFKHVDKIQAEILLLLVVVQIPVSFFMEALNICALKLIKGDVLKTFEISQRYDLAHLLLKLTDYSMIALESFWGLWLFPFGYLVYKSGFIPRILGIFLVINGVAYIIHCLFHLLWPAYQALVFKLATPLWTLGEISIMLWLLLKGIRNVNPETKDGVEI